MSRKRSWTKEDLEAAVKKSTSIRQTIEEYAWNRGIKCRRLPLIALEKILNNETFYQSHKLKLRLFEAGLKKKACEECNWSKISVDGRIPLELDHIDGNRDNNQLGNLRILCPNCHSLQPTHRGLNKKKKA